MPVKARRTPTKYAGITKLQWENGTVNYRATLPHYIDAAGRRVDPTKHFPTLKEARYWRTERLGLRQRGIRTPTGRVTLGEYVDGWLERYAKRQGTAVTRHHCAVAKLRRLPIWKLKLADVEPDDIGRAYDEIVPKELLYLHDALHRALADAVPRLIGRNPASGAMRGRKYQRPERVVWDETEYRAFLAAAANDDFYCLWLTIGQTGLRRGEALGLDWSDVDLDAAQLSIRRQYAPVGGKAALRDVKTPRARRTIEIDAGLVQVLREHQRHQKVKRVGRDAHAVFTYADGSRVGPTSALNDRLDDVIERAGVRRLTIHDMRHVHATLALRRGVPVHVVSKRLGHASEGFTLQQYAHVLPDQGRFAAEAAAAIAGKLPVRILPS